ncbi:MAG: prolyl oligopeptidase family serine peptidase [Myxococcota bacterium]
MRPLRTMYLLLLPLLACQHPPVNSPVVSPTPSQGHTANLKSSPYHYPAAERVDQIDDYHGTQVADPYRWLESPDSLRTRAWIDAQNKLTQTYLTQVPERDAIKHRLTELWNFERTTVPRKKRGRYFYEKNDGLQNQNVIMTMEGLTGSPRVLLDPNHLSKDGTVAFAGGKVSENGKYFAYALQQSGSDWMQWYVRDVDSGKDLSDHIQWVKFSTVAWSPDNSGFFYSRFPAPEEGNKLEQANYFNKLYYHRLGTTQDEDPLIYERPDEKTWGFLPQVSEDGRYLIISIYKGTADKYRIYYQDLSRQQGKVTALIDDHNNRFDFIGNKGSVLWFLTDLDAPRGRVIAIDLRRPARKNWRELIPQSDHTLQDVNVVGGHFVANYLQHAHSMIKVFKTNGKWVRDVELPALGTAEGFGGRADDPETFYDFSSFTTPNTIFRYDVVSGKSAVFHRPKVAFNPDDYVTRQVFYHSKDGTQIPMFLTHKKDLDTDGNRPTFLYGYGGFNISITPQFRVSQLVWMEMGGVFAVANLRGGGEYGEEWHQAGMKLNKQNVFDDFIAAGEWLIDNDYTSPGRLALGGRSNGGLLIGAVTNQRPDLFAAGLAGVGVMDMLRFQKFTIGWAWVDDYGSSDDAQQFKALIAYSPYHNVRKTAYPAIMVTTADHDDRVVPGHSFKYTAAMQHAQQGPRPILARIETKAGHGAGKPTSKLIEQAADEWAFVVRELKVQAPALMTAANGQRRNEAVAP